MFDRYAIFYTPAIGAFADFCAAWLGWDSAEGKPVPHPDVDGLDLPSLIKRPQKYGFHATLRAPFRLAKGQSEETLLQAVVDFGGKHQPASLGRLKVCASHGFVALHPTRDPAPIRAFAGHVVRDFARFCAPLSPEDIARRRQSRLTDRQDRQMLEWGYPFIFEDFNFHMTLTGGLGMAKAEALVPRISQLFMPHLPNAPVIDALTLLGQDQDGRFHQLSRIGLNG
ncbi:MAG: DUF1045 domain-containing protein [Sulfitobacter sp.]